MGGLERAVDAVERWSMSASNVMLISCFLGFWAGYAGTGFLVFGSPYIFSRQSTFAFKVSVALLTWVWNALAFVLTSALNCSNWAAMAFVLAAP